MINIPKYRSVQNFSKTNIYEIIKNQEESKKVILKKLKEVNVDSKTTSLVFFERESTDEIYLYEGFIVVGAVIDDKFNEELDTMTINLVHSKEDDFLSYLIPNNTKVLYIPQVKCSDVIVTSENGEQHINFEKLFVFDDDDKPINHKQYIVCGGSISFGKNVIKHQYGLVEPTALLRLGYTGTNSHTNMPEAVIYDTAGNRIVYKQSKTNLYNIIERQFKITGLKNNNEDRTWFKHFNIKGIDVNSGVGISESFNNATLYDSMFKLGKYIKCYPVVYFNNKYSSLYEYQKEFNLFFESYELRNQKKINLTDINYLEANWSIVNSTGRFTNHVVCEAENIIPTQEIVYPYEEEYVGLTGDLSEITFSEPGDKQPIPYYLRVGKKIQNVSEVTMIIINGNHGASYTSDSPIRNHYDAVEYDDWVLLSDTSRANTAYYTIGDDKIYVGHLDLIKNNHYNQDLNIYIGRVKYKPLIKAKIESGIGDYTDIYNQTDSNLDGNLFGNYLQEYASSQTNYDILFQAVFENYNDIPESGTIISNNETDLIITSRKILVNKTSFYVSFALNYYEPKRSELINASKKITKTFVDSSKAFERMVNFKETFLIDITTKEDEILNEQPIYFRDYQSVLPFFDDEKSKVNSMGIAFKFDNENHDKTYSKTLKASLSNSVIGTSIVFELTAQSSKIFGVYGGFIELGNEKDYNKNQIVYYTDVFGKVRSIDLVFSYLKNYNENQTIDSAFDEMLDKYENAEESLYYDEIKYKILLTFGENVRESLNSYYEISDDNFKALKETSVLNIEDLNISKDTNEILNFTYQIEFLPKYKNRVMIFNNFARFANFINHKSMEGLFLSEMENTDFDSSAESISNYGLNKVEINENTSFKNAFDLKIHEMKLDKNKQYVLFGKYNSNYYPLLAIFNTETNWVVDGECSSLILYIINGN